ncbi:MULTISPECIES: AraC family transcriptional regulator [unclassified Leptolyngbya]|uniref:helix-turn-helix domain-containing protein n=1 Tax=unclassified Leptolyngbya TaxID=2650499 RepID=UPI0016844FCF|nr:MULTISPECIES: AraC family transcriptional regulator [unclassified Leptolyngbya]MBD1909798.1 helix-turn-helix transcriptional regulator [Leptolyngbya sp. FACHB-8]MBD2158949.1 helix-turn-helix transcriptional regulator [Leptolyngbya sp. FACHB-16]
MPERPSLTIDLTQSSELLQLVPRPPLLTSQQAEWKNILVQHHQQPPWEMPENTVNQHVVVVHHKVGSRLQVNRTMNAIKRQEYMRNGSCVIVPAAVPHESSWGHEAEFTLLIFEPAYLAQLAYETLEGDRIELIPQFARIDPIIASVGSALKAELESDSIRGRLYAESAAVFLATHLLHHYCSRTHPIKVTAKGLPKYKLQQAIAYIEAHLGEEISLEAIANHLNMSQYYFCHLFKKSMGVSPYQYVLQQRINKAKHLLKHQKSVITDVALECGFANQTHFTKHFRKLTGITPRSYREQYSFTHFG